MNYIDQFTSVIVYLKQQNTMLMIYLGEQISNGEFLPR